MKKTVFEWLNFAISKGNLGLISNHTNNFRRNNTYAWISACSRFTRADLSQIALEIMWLPLLIDCLIPALLPKKTYLE